MNIDAKKETDLKIKQLLENYPTFDKAKKVKSIHSFIYCFAGILSFVIAQYSLFGFDLNTNVLAASNIVVWWNYLLAILGVMGMCFFCFKVISIPIDINRRLQSEELINIVTVAEYNPRIKDYIKANEPLTKRDYYYLNIDEQLDIITNIKGMSDLAQAMLVEPKATSTALSNALSEVKVQAFTSQEEIHKIIAGYKKKAIGTLCLFVGIITAASIVDMVFTPLIRGISLLSCIVLFFSMLYFLSQVFRVRDTEQETIDTKTYRAIIELCAYNPDVRTYINSVIQEDRYLNARDEWALSVGNQVERLRYVNLMESQLS